MLVHFACAAIGHEVDAKAAATMKITPRSSDLFNITILSKSDRIHHRTLRGTECFELPATIKRYVLNSRLANSAGISGMMPATRDADAILARNRGA